MKILFFTRRFWPDIGGVETHVREVGKRLVEMGHEVTVVSEEPAGNALELSDTVSGMRVFRIPVGKSEKRKKFVIWKWLQKRKGLIEDADVVHCHDVFFWYLPFRLRYPRKKVYTTFHGYETKFPPEKKAIRMRKISEVLSRGNICVGDYIKKWYGTRATYTTYGGAETMQSAKSVEQRENWKLENDKLKIAFIGRLEEDTGVLQYLELLALLKQNKIEYTFTAVGDGVLKKKVSEYGDVVGFVEDVSTYLQHADIIFASSYLAMLESLALQKLVIALYDNDLKKDYLLMSPFAQYIIAEESAQVAFKKLKFFILNPNRLKKIIAEGHDWAIQQTWDNVTKFYLKLWKR